MSEIFNFVAVIPMANESKEFRPFIDVMRNTLDSLKGGTVYSVVDHASKDNTLALCRLLSSRDKRFKTLWVPENRHVVYAYLAGYKEVIKNRPMNYPSIWKGD